MFLDESTLIDILESARLAESFCEGYSKREFLKDRKTQSAVLHQLLLLGEATKRLSDSLKAKNKNIPWKVIAGMRDKLIHAYDEVDLEMVWNTIKKDLPELIENVEAMISKGR